MRENTEAHECECECFDAQTLLGSTLESQEQKAGMHDDGTDENRCEKDTAGGSKPRAAHVLLEKTEQKATRLFLWWSGATRDSVVWHKHEDEHEKAKERHYSYSYSTTFYD